MYVLDNGNNYFGKQSVHYKETVETIEFHCISLHEDEVILS